MWYREMWGFEMLVDGKVRRICVTKVDGVKEVREFAQGEMAEQHAEHRIDIRKVLRTTVVIVGAGPAGLAVREEFEKYGIDNIVIDNNDRLAVNLICRPTSSSFSRKKSVSGVCADLILPKH